MPFSSTPRKYSGFLLFAGPVCLFFLAAWTLYPFYQYRIVSDDISYLAIARRYLQGDYAQAVNGYWSPLNIWLLALLVKCSGWNLLTAAYWLNCLSFSGIIILTIKLFKKFTESYFELTVFGLFAALFWAANIPVTHFADALNTCLLLGCLLLLLRKDFLQHKKWWFIYGLLSATAYFSKAYSFYIIPLSTAVILWARLKQQDTFSFKKWLLVLGCTTGSMLLCSLPWLWLLHEKYGQWMISSAGVINTNWAIKGYMYFSKDHPVIVPPAYPDGLSCWEDPWLGRGEKLSPFGSGALLVKQLFRIAMNVLQWFKVMAEFSPFYFPVWLFGLLYLLRRKVSSWEPARATVILAFLLFPAGYFTLSFGTRYLWFTVPLVMITGLQLFRQYLLPVLQPGLYRFFVLFYMASWLPGAVFELKASFNEGKNDFTVAARLTAMNIKGSFITSDYAGYQHHFRISWFSNNPYYMHFGDNWNTATLVNEARKLGVKYYYYFYQGADNDYLLQDDAGRPYPEVTGGRIEGLKVFQLQP
jgi:4-amino-4-deoxy-L-arabinose transferase-like glycosyltransferase